MKHELVGYAPDADPTTPGVFTNCSAIVPTLRGFKAAPSAAATNVTAALAAACKGSAVLRKLDDSSRFFAGTAAALYEAAGASWTDRTRASGGAYSVATDGRWRFAQFGDVSLAVNKADLLQVSASGAFADAAADVPKASVVEVVGQFVFLLDVNDQGAIGPYGDNPARWWCCKKGDYTVWTPSIPSECATGTLTSAPGKIRAGRRFGDSIVVYKHRAMYLGVYVGQPAIWDFRQIPGEAGAVCQESVVNVGTTSNPRHVFMGFDDFYSFDGSRPVSIAENWVKQTVFSELNKQYAESSMAMRDPINNLVYFFYPSASSSNPDKCVVYNDRTGRWGRDDRSVESVVEYITAGVTYDDLGALYATYGDFPNVSYDSSFWTSSFPVPAIFDTNHTVKALNGTPGSSSITTGDIGDDISEAHLNRVKPRFLTAPTSGSMVNYYRQNLGDVLTTDATTTLSSSRFDVRREARWHRLRYDYEGPMEKNLIDYDIRQGGEE